MNGIALRAAPAGANTDSVSVYSRLGEVAMPAQVICGDWDFPHIVARCRQLATALPQATHHALPGAAHLPSMEKPAEITTLILEFLGRNFSRHPRA